MTAKEADARVIKLNTLGRNRTPPEIEEFFYLLKRLGRHPLNGDNDPPAGEIWAVAP